MNAAELARHWDVGGVAVPVPLDGGSVNGAWRVPSTAGHVHLRVYGSPDRARAEREHAAIAVAVAAGVPTPAPPPSVPFSHDWQASGLHTGP